MRGGTLSTLRRGELGSDWSRDRSFRAEAQHTIEDMKEELRGTDLPVKLFLEKKPTAAHAALLQEISVFIQDFSYDFREEFVHAFEEVITGSPASKERILAFLKERKMDLPRFTVCDGHFAVALLRKFGFPNPQLAEHRVLVVFNLPKHLARYWWKGDGQWGKGGQETHGTVMEWGSLYRKLMPIVWGHVDRDAHGLQFLRQNVRGDHDPQQFYYIWEVRKAKKAE